MVWLRNPDTGRNILKGGRTYNRLKNQGIDVNSFSRVRNRWTKQRKRSTSPRKRKVKTRKTTRRKSARATRGRPLTQTLKDVPKERKATREKLKQQLSHTREGRGIRTRGWAAAAPQRGKERRELYEKCGAKCFLEPNPEDPGKSGFPICAALRENQGCKVDCRGVTSAFVRARQYRQRHPGVAVRAKRIQDRVCSR